MRSSQASGSYTLTFDGRGNLPDGGSLPISDIGRIEPIALKRPFAIAPRPPRVPAQQWAYSRQLPAAPEQAHRIFLIDDHAVGHLCVLQDSAKQRDDMMRRWHLSAPF